MERPSTPEDSTLVFTRTEEQTRFEQETPVGHSGREADLPLPAGTRLGEFEVRKVLGIGGFGIVYEVWDHSLDCEAAVKEFMPTDLVYREATTVCLRSERHRGTFDAGLKSFVNEAKSLASLAKSHHSGLVRVNRFWEQNGTAYMAMPLYRGPTVKAWVQDLEKPPSEAWLSDWLLLLTEALELVHSVNLVHRDISPDNVILLEGSGRPLLLDFGAARRVISEATQTLTAILKPSYAPVEQYGDIPGLAQGPWTDVYSLCATVHFILLKKPPPPSVGRAVSDSYEPLTQALAGHYSPRLLAAIDKGLSFKPAERFQSMGELRAALGFAGGAESTTVSKAGTKNLQPSLQSPSGVPVEPQLGVEGSGQRPASELRSGRHALSGLLTVGQVIGGRLEVSATIRLGTALEWYRGHEIETGAEVLIATVSPRLACDSALLDKMEAQAKLWKALAVVPGIVPLLEVIRSESGMTYIFRAPAGASVRQLLLDRQAEGRLFSASEATRMVASLAVPLARVHEQTACLLLTPDVIWSDGKGGYAVAGTGLEMALGREGLCQLVVQEGLQAYLAPELTQRRSSAAGRREQLPNADQYSLAVIVYEMVSGAVPEAGTYAVPLDKVDAQASAAAAHAVAAALKLKPQARFPSVEEFAQALASTMTPTRRRTVWALSATLAFALVSGSAWMGWHYFQARTLEQSALNARAALQSELQSLDATQSEWANESASLDQRVKLLEAQAKASPEEANDAYGLGRSVARAKREGVAILDGRKLFEALVVSSADVRESRQALEAGQGSWGLGKRQEALDTWSSALLAAKEANKNAEQIKVTMQLLAQAAGRVADFEALARDVDSVDLDRARAELSRASQALSSGQFGQARELALATSSRLEADVARELPKVRAKWGRQAEAMPLGPEFDELVRRGRNLCGWAENVCK